MMISIATKCQFFELCITIFRRWYAARWHKFLASAHVSYDFALIFISIYRSRISSKRNCGVFLKKWVEAMNASMPALYLISEQSRISACEDVSGEWISTSLLPEARIDTASNRRRPPRYRRRSAWFDGHSQNDHFARMQKINILEEQMIIGWHLVMAQEVVRFRHQSWRKYGRVPEVHYFILAMPRQARRNIVSSDFKLSRHISIINHEFISWCSYLLPISPDNRQRGNSVCAHSIRRCHFKLILQLMAAHYLSLIRSYQSEFQSDGRVWVMWCLARLKNDKAASDE